MGLTVDIFGPPKLGDSEILPNSQVEKINRWEVFGSGSGPEIGLGSNTRLLSRNNTLEIIRVNSDNEGTDQLL